MAAVLHTAAKKWLDKSPFDNLDLDSLNEFDLKMLIAETIKEFSQSFRGERRPVFVIILTDVTRTDSRLFTLNYLRSIISEGGEIAWLVFAPRMILYIKDPSGVSPFHNIFPICDLNTKSVKIPNYYGSLLPVRGEMFFGRNQIMADIQQSIVQGSCPIALWGPRRIGKTSVLLNLFEPLRTYCFPVFVDISVIFGDISLFYLVLAQGIRRHDEAREFDKILPHSDQDISYDMLMGIVSRVEKYTHRKVVYLLDEIEAIEECEDGLLALRQLANAGLVGCITGAGRVKEWLSDPTSPIFNVFTERKIGCLERDAAIELITRPVKNMVSYEPGAINEILRLMGTHPMLVNMLCYRVLSLLEDEYKVIVTTEMVRRADEAGRFEIVDLVHRTIQESLHCHCLHSENYHLCLHLLEAFAQISNRTGQTRIGKEELLKYVIENRLPSEEGDLSVENANFQNKVEQAIEILCDEEIFETVGNQCGVKAQVYLDTLAHFYLGYDRIP